MPKARAPTKAEMDRALESAKNAGAKSLTVQFDRGRFVFDLTKPASAEDEEWPNLDEEDHDPAA